MIKGFRINRNDRRVYTMGTTAVSREAHLSFASKGEACAVVFYRKGAGSPKGRIRFPANARTGDVWNMTILGDFSGLEHVYGVDGQQVPDPYGRGFTNMERWGSPMYLNKPVCTPMDTEGNAYDWEKGVLPCIPYSQRVIYHIHPRGLTKHASSGVEGDSRGTFKGVAEKIPYLRDLGVTTVEMVPPTEFEGLITPERVGGSPFATEKPDGKLSYWGYTRGYCFAPRCAHNSGPVRQPEREFKDMVKALHKAGLELVLELFFNGKEVLSYVLDVVRFWAQEYHVDGVRLVGYAPMKLLGEDLYLSRLKLLAPGWDGVEPGRIKHLTEYNDGFVVNMRSFLEGNEDQLNRLVYHIRHSPQQAGVISYAANTNGFTLMDMVSYDIKHNEANGEDNRDKTDYNQSWNCGTENPSRKERIMQMRRKQTRDALLMLFLSRETPLLMMGDELGRTKKGNNNSYCQDNDISWLNWGLLDSNNSIHESVRHVIRFRKEHSVFHMEKEPALMGYRRVGLPGVSCHDLKTWCPMLDRFLRQLGILYYEKYGKKPDGREDDYFYVAFNMHWEPHEFTPPSLSKDFKWHIAFNTDEDRVNGMYPRGGGPILENQKSMMIMARAIVVLMEEEVALLKKAARGKAAGKGERREEETHGTVRGNDAVYRGPQAGGIRPSPGIGQNTDTL